MKEDSVLIMNITYRKAGIHYNINKYFTEGRKHRSLTKKVRFFSWLFL